MEVYVDDMLTKSVIAEKHPEDLKETFDVLRRYKMKLNPSKCVFGVPSGWFLGFQVHQRGIEVNPEKIKALEEMTSPKTMKDVQRLTGCLASLNRFIAKSTDKSSNTHGSGAGIVITTPEGDAVECAIRFDFKTTNNQAGYEALLAGLRVCIALGADELEVFSDS
ncbi:hypothetical protein Q3G72_026716 [Acer saccharum]|nr:hypothetical protein Q3G72_026716 [Acer saccharum]